MFRTSISRSLRSCAPLRSVNVSRPFSASIFGSDGLKPLDVLSEDEKMIREKVREIDENEQIDPDVIKGLSEQGVFDGYGNLPTAAQNPPSHLLSSQSSLAKADPAVSALCDVHNTLVNTVVRKHATEAQKEKLLPLLATEKKVGDNYVLNGTKMWITNSNEARIFLIFANVRFMGDFRLLTSKLTSSIWSRHGLKLQRTNRNWVSEHRPPAHSVLNFDNVKIPAENILGGEGQGYKEPSKAWPFPLLKPRQRSRSLAYNAARRKEAGLSFVKGAAMAKWWASKVAQEVSGNAVEWIGGLGFTREMGVEEFWRDSKIGAIYEGTSNIQLQAIAKFMQKEYTPRSQVSIKIAYNLECYLVVPESFQLHDHRMYTANGILGISRDQAKVFDYSRIYRVLEEAQKLAENLYASTKGKNTHRNDLFNGKFWYGGIES
ncbi:acyl-CoA dehydrogenase/oxidase [Lentinula raphanica]|nr:acyl-CoA dehydrogenase/oxidase [Lentinula raphanica]